MKKKLILFLILLVSGVLLFPQVLSAAESGEELTIALGVDPDNLDPSRSVTSPGSMMALHMTETLFEMSPAGEIEPLLAEDYQVAENGQEYEIYLREGIEFQDGSYFDAEAVKYNLERIQKEEGPNAFLIEKVSEIEVVDDYTLMLRTEEPFAPLISNLSNQAISILSPEALETKGEDISSRPVGTGPFELEEWNRGEEVIMTRNEDYWGENARLDRLTFEIVPEGSSRVIMVETGEADAIMGVPPRDRDRLNSNPDIDVLEVPSLRMMFAGFNTQQPPFDDPRVRRALNYAVDNEAIVEQIMDGAGIPADAPISPNVFGHAEQEMYDYDPEKAEKLLTEAGYEEGFSLELYHPSGRYMMDETIAQALQNQLAEVGVEVELVTMEFTTLLETIAQAPEDAEHDMYLLGYSAATGDADYFLYALFHTSQRAPQGNNFSYLEAENLDNLLEAARATADLDQRQDLYAEINQLIWREAPWIFLHSEVQLNAVREGVKGLIHHPQEYISAKDAYFE